MHSVTEYFDFSQPSFYFALANILFNPIFWNIAARAEYQSHILTKLAGGHAFRGCAVLALSIFSLGILRDYLYKSALEFQPIYPLLQHDAVKAVAVVLFLTGNVLVLSSMWALGFTGTYLGDYFGILMDARVTGFPFNVCEDPMYTGSTFSFLATALWYASPAGLLLTFVVHVVYRVALRYEGPFTAMIYANKDKKQ
ncbi:phospholipid methyltransferase-domain-containing protein [Absidia repens]|uniref:Phosphatidyl-N-methylethanolamine N-methyltransferase n=1 Tax=Absidia repens TaxID=90262 RepID=A0A1X2I163_9FUNG|nr:phospholipid methyltransferase-domain-containing protein [Absidia repens]